MAAEADQYSNELRSTNGQISEFTRKISRLQNEIKAAKAQVGEGLIRVPNVFKVKDMIWAELKDCFCRGLCL